MNFDRGAGVVLYDSAEIQKM